MLAKIESFTPGYSVKDRIGVSMIEDAEAQGLITPGKTVLVEPTSGNTGIALAWVAAAKGYRLILTMPESMSLERRVLLLAYGAEVVLTPASEGMAGAVRKAEQIASETTDAWIPAQFANPANPEIHRKTTAVEIWQDTDGAVDYVVAGIGTGGTITGVGQVLKGLKPEIKMIAVEPTESPLLSAGTFGPHKIQGIGANFVPVCSRSRGLRRSPTVSSEEAFANARAPATTEGLLSASPRVQLPRPPRTSHPDQSPLARRLWLSSRRLESATSAPSSSRNSARGSRPHRRITFPVQPSTLTSGVANVASPFSYRRLRAGSETCPRDRAESGCDPLLQEKLAAIRSSPSIVQRTPVINVSMEHVRPRTPPHPIYHI